MSTATGENENTTKANERLVLKLKAQRVYQNVNALGILAESVMNRVEDHDEVKVNEEELDKISKDVLELQERLIKAVKA